MINYPALVSVPTYAAAAVWSLVHGNKPMALAWACWSVANVCLIYTEFKASGR